jgi:hypothetical protein
LVTAKLEATPEILCVAFLVADGPGERFEREGGEGIGEHDRGPARCRLPSTASKQPPDAASTPGDPNSNAMRNRTSCSECYDRRRGLSMDHHDRFAAALL